MHEILPRDVKLLGAHGHAAGGHELVDILGELLYVFLRTVGAAARLIHEKDRVRLKIVRRRLEGFIQKRHIAVRRVQRQGRCERVRVLLERAGEIGSQRLVFAPRGALRELAELLAEGETAAGIERGERLGSGQDAAARNGLGAPLGRDIEIAHGVNVVAPELDAHGAVLRRGKEIENAAAAAELAGALHLLRAHIAAAQKRVLRVLRRETAAVLDREGDILQHLLRDCALQESRDRRHQHGTFLRGEQIQCAETALLGLARDAQRRIERIVTRREHRHGDAQQMRQIARK